ncbi:unnamed protein product [Kuraishia capsulata CBS 1993]|uniref:Uncharacterized protein n=1 Tax=Kuraishia capsulata CBS 1993 TaxID=1382522 RepID=W6MN45_9ASCO|nr:uncharacterized protein KUCA_T00002429001 [Kuraishia capsulata CBS 1993]CDK26457.1 unnamed protein product [Kuraishia capsulata CBS 1993]
MFSARTFRASGEENFITPAEFTQKAREDVNKRLQTFQQNLKPNLKYGSSPLRNNSITASSLEVTNSSDDAVSMESEKSQSSLQPKKKKYFGFLHRTKSNESSKSSRLRSGESLSSITEDSVLMDVDSEQTDSSHELHRINTNTSCPSIPSVFTNASDITANSSVLQNSLFSNQLFTVYTASTEESAAVHPSGVGLSDRSFELSKVLPHDYTDMYAPDLESERFSNGRPVFTKRDLIDWELNDVRSLLIVESLRPEWEGSLPQINSVIPLRLQYIPLDCSDEVFANSLVESDIYKESNFDVGFRYKTAKYIVSSARLRHASTLIEEYSIPRECFAEDGNLLPEVKDTYYAHFFKYEWRNMIENFLLNLAVESQCRHDFRKVCLALKRERARSQSSLQTVTPPKKSLLLKAIMSSSGPAPLPTLPHSKLTHEEKTHLWASVQANVYRRLSLDWKPDLVSA